MFTFLINFSKDYIRDIHKTVSPKIDFIELDYSLPKHIKKSELFLFRDNNYAKNHFGPHKNWIFTYLINYFVEFYNYKNTKFKEFDYTMSFDDDSLLKPIDFDIFSRLKDIKILMGSLNTSNLIYSLPRTLDTRSFNLEFVKYYINK